MNFAIVDEICIVENGKPEKSFHLENLNTQ